MASLRCTNSSEYGMQTAEGDVAEFSGGSPEGGYAITLVGSGFDGYDGNPATMRVRFATQSVVSDAAHTRSTRGVSSAADGGNGTSEKNGTRQVTQDTSKKITVTSMFETQSDVAGPSFWLSMSLDALFDAVSLSASFNCLLPS